MDPVTTAIVSTAISGFSAFNEYKAGKQAKKESQLLTDQQVSDERNRAAAEMAERRARAAASGIQVSGSPALFMQQAAKTDRERVDWMKRTGKVKANALQSQGQASALSTLSGIPGYWT